VGRDRTCRFWKVAEDSQLIFRPNPGAGQLECCAFTSPDTWITGKAVAVALLHHSIPRGGHSIEPSHGPHRLLHHSTPGACHSIEPSHGPYYWLSSIESWHSHSRVSLDWGYVDYTGCHQNWNRVLTVYTKERE
jgi:hypothetical protein